MQIMINYSTAVLEAFGEFLGTDTMMCIIGVIMFVYLFKQCILVFR